MKGKSAIFLCILVKLPIFFNFLYFSKQIQFESILSLIQHITNDLHTEKFAIRLDLMKIQKELLIMPILFDRSKRTHYRWFDLGGQFLVTNAILLLSTMCKIFTKIRAPVWAHEAKNVRARRVLKLFLLDGLT